MKTNACIEFGDFQTPPALAEQICAVVRARCGDFAAVVEPTCGRGAFLIAAGAAFPRAMLCGREINPAYVETARAALSDAGFSGRADVGVQDFFSADWNVEISAFPGRLLLLGNPPWVTNAGVATIGGSNLPVKANFQGMRGLEARTGKANFDISEWMLIRLLEAARPRAAVLAMLCKTATARKFLRYAWRHDGRVTRASVHRIDAARHFGAAVDACLLIAELGENGPAEADLFASLDAPRPAQRFGLAGKNLVADLPTYRRCQHLEGLSPYQWRSGLKHDCAPVMELTSAGPGLFRNQLDEVIPLEANIVFPLLKCTHLARGRLAPERWVIVTQRRVGEATDDIARRAPQAWAYLQSHAARFAARKSSIYKSSPPFALFGIGEYAFAPWKVAISALHRPPSFVVVPPLEARPVMFDDTCYFLPLWSETEARIVAAVLNSPSSLSFIESLTFPEAKRPVTTELLHRLNFRALAEEAGLLPDWEEVRGLRESSGSAVGQLEMVMERPQS